MGPTGPPEQPRARPSETVAYRSYPSSADILRQNLDAQLRSHLAGTGRAQTKPPGQQADNIKSMEDDLKRMLNLGGKSKGAFDKDG